MHAINPSQPFSLTSMHYHERKGLVAMPTTRQSARDSLTKFYAAGELPVNTVAVMPALLHTSCLLHCA